MATYEQAENANEGAAQTATGQAGAEPAGTVFATEPRNRVRRIPDRGAYDAAAIYPILDAALLCHVGFVQDGQPFVIPTIHARRGDTLLLHGAKAARLLKHVQAGEPVCVCVTLLDGLVLARSVFDSSMNYRSAVVFGRGHSLDDPDAKLEALRVISDHLQAGRWDDARLPTPKELAATAVVELTIESASAKTRSGGPHDEEEDYALPIWAGVIPIRQVWLDPEPDARLDPAIPLPAYLQHPGTQDSEGQSGQG